MNCRIFSKSLKDYIAGELSGESNEMMAKHINSCEECRKLYNEQVSVYKSMQNMSSVQENTFKSSRNEILLAIDKSRYNKSFGNSLGFFIKRNGLIYAASSVAIIAIVVVSLFALINHRGGTPSVHPRNHAVTAGTDKVYKNEQLGFSFTISKDWEGKYTIKEKSDGVYVYFKPLVPTDKGDGLLFCIVKKTSESDEDHWDTVGKPRNFVAKQITYIVGGPRDARFPSDNKEFSQFYKMQQEVPDIVATIKVLEDNTDTNNINNNNINDNSNTGAGIVYKNEKLGFSFTISKDWEGKYTIKEKSVGVYVYFKPSIPTDQGDGLLFCIVKKTSESDEDHWDTVGKPRNFVAKQITYIVGGPTDVRFPPDNKEFSQFQKMQQEIPSIVATIKIKIEKNTNATDTTNNTTNTSTDTAYKNEKLGFSFTINKDWEGKYTIKEKSDGVYVYFKPLVPTDQGDGLLFCIVKKTSDSDEDHWDTVGKPRNFVAKQITYIVGGPTDVRFPPDNKEFTQFQKMQQEISDIVSTIKVIG